MARISARTIHEEEASEGERERERESNFSGGVVAWLGSCFSHFERRRGRAVILREINSYWLHRGSWKPWRLDRLSSALSLNYRRFVVSPFDTFNWQPRFSDGHSSLFALYLRFFFFFSFDWFSREFSNVACLKFGTLKKWFWALGATTRIRVSIFASLRQSRIHFV